MAMSIKLSRTNTLSKRTYDDSETKEQIEIIKFLHSYYPTIRVDGNINGLYLNELQAIKAKRMGMRRDCPDLHIKHKSGDYHCLYIEYKSDKKNSIYKKDGSLLKNEHVMSQAIELERLQEQGDAATFACGIVNAIAAIKDYLNGDFVNPNVFKKCKYG